MTASFTIQRATVNDAHEIAVMVGELLNEIMSAIGISFFNFSLDETTARLIDFIGREKYYVFVARNENARPISFVSLYEGYRASHSGQRSAHFPVTAQPKKRSCTICRSGFKPTSRDLGGLAFLLELIFTTRHCIFRTHEDSIIHCFHNNLHQATVARDTIPLPQLVPVLT
jgi:hypothetical protein